MKSDARGKVVELRGRTIPRDEKGDPAFTHLYNDEFDKGPYTGPLDLRSLLLQFSAEEIVQMVNRYLYQQEYQRVAHRNRARTEAEALAPLKAALLKLFGVSHLKATDEQIQAAVEAVKLDQQKK